MTRRLNITLPEQTVALMDRVAGKGQRSRLIDVAVHRYVEKKAAPTCVSNCGKVPGSEPNATSTWSRSGDRRRGLA